MAVNEEHFDPVVVLSEDISLVFMSTAHTRGLAQFMRDPDVAKFVPWSSLPVERVIQKANTDIAKNGALYAIEAKGSFAGFFTIFPSPDPEYPALVEVGYGLLPEFRGQGIVDLAFEFVADLREKNPDAEFGLCIHDDNKASISVAKRLGFTSTEDLSLGGQGIPPRFMIASSKDQGFEGFWGWIVLTVALG